MRQQPNPLARTTVCMDDRGPPSGGGHHPTVIAWRPHLQYTVVCRHVCLCVNRSEAVCVLSVDGVGCGNDTRWSDVGDHLV